MRVIEITDNELVVSILNGNVNKFAVLVKRYERLVFSFLISHKCKLQVAEEIVQSSFIRAFKYLNTYDRKRKFSNWLLTITRNLLIDSCKNSDRFVSASEITNDLLSFESENSKSNQPPEILIKRERFRKVSEMILGLNDTVRIPFIMRIVNEQSYQEIADILDLPLQTVKNRIFQARRLLKDQRWKLYEVS